MIAVTTTGAILLVVALKQDDRIEIMVTIGDAKSPPV